MEEGDAIGMQDETESRVALVVALDQSSETSFHVWISASSGRSWMLEETLRWSASKTLPFQPDGLSPALQGIV